MLFLKGCMKCGGDLYMDYGDWMCLQCGKYYYRTSPLGYIRREGAWGNSSRATHQKKRTSRQTLGNKSLVGVGDV